MVAIKIYDKYKLHANAQVKTSVSKEIKLLSSLCNSERTSDIRNFGKGHPNIMKLYDAIDTPKQLYLICERVEGKMLHHILQEAPGKRLHVDICTKIFKQICLGMEAYHRLYIAHRDLKPENVLVDMKSKEYGTKIIDFGFAAKSKEKL
jgi:5'-AMP-activated protein kinase catalytic alpha subunit